MRWRNFDIPDQHILSYIENNIRFQKKVSRLIGSIYKARDKTPPEERVKNATAGSDARWKKDQK
jgi:hypothetical protein